MKLIIAEKPSLALKIVEAIGGMKKMKDAYAGNGYIVTSVFGHLLTLYDLNEYLDKEDPKKWDLEDLKFFPKEFKFKLKNDSSIRERYKVIKDFIKQEQITEIINAR